ncbi:nucleotide-diphospho-sugar transferase [Pedobacter frigidisoli]|uniref:Nucleotide-diphospho-sugar transferase n=1 Tax=Pedobacter frigidisoli TaxID=2530455 RepID=A0A4R0P2E1_9SPHI|nr:nucleotide-diphospho-sugar transferase [Pedobacter frigidisoli]TCD07732.1 nucleotide-diphospho-sugar transferase [Pedobacter frigidisoli]
MYDIPILFLIFNRPSQTKLVFEEIRKQKPKYLFVAADGPRNLNGLDEQLCAETRDIISLIDWDCELRTLFRSENLGSKKAVSLAISWFFKHHELGVILEDDCLPNESFFSFTKSLLHKFQNDERIMMINGCSFQPRPLDSNSYYFSKYVHVWGWASWRRAWDLYNVDLISETKEERNTVIEQTFKSRREQQQWKHNLGLISEGLDAWDYQWMYWIWKNKGITVTPWLNMISNIGFGSDATHTFDERSSQSRMKQYKLNNIFHPEEVSINIKADSIERSNTIVSPLRQALFWKIRANIKYTLSILSYWKR